MPLLSGTLVAGSGLVDLSLETDLDWDFVGVTVDGALSAVVPGGPATAHTTIASVWVPPGDHTICVGEAPPGAARTYAGLPDPDADTPPTPIVPAACGQISGTIDANDPLLPDNRVVAYYGTGVTSGLGVLGEGTPEEATQRLMETATGYTDYGLPVIPAFEFIATVAQPYPGTDGTYSAAMPHEQIVPYLESVRSVGGIMVLDLQPGRTAFLEQAKALEPFLIEPDVHLALDPEWSMNDDQVPGRIIGSTKAAQVNKVLTYIGELVLRHGLPEKLVIVHQFRADMVNNRHRITDPPGIAVMFHVDGQGPVGSKYSTYDQLYVEPPFFNGFKVFFDEDSRVMTPEEVMAIEPQPLYVSYQ